VALIAGKLSCTFSRDLDLITLLDHCEIDPFSPVEGEPKTVKPWAKVCGGGWNLHGHGPTSGQHQKS
jgi:hypothetical protein